MPIIAAPVYGGMHYRTSGVHGDLGDGDGASGGGSGDRLSLLGLLLIGLARLRSAGIMNPAQGHITDA